VEVRHFEHISFPKRAYTPGHGYSWMQAKNVDHGVIVEVIVGNAYESVVKQS
jgi:hypothetical protein